MHFNNAAGTTNTRNNGLSLKSKRVLIYSHDTVGLGNIRRTLVIANRLVERRPDLSVLIVTGSPMLHAFRLQPGIDYLKLPCLDRGSADEYRVKSLSVEFNEVLNLRANLIQQTMTDFKPDLVLVDKKPLGVERELAPAFELLALRGQRPKCALILRDILDTPEQTTRIWRDHRYYEALDAFYDEILVLGSPKIFDVAKEYNFPRSAAKRVRYCGYLRRPKGRRSVVEVRSRFLSSDRPLILVTVGGGQDGGPLLENYLNALMCLESDTRPDSLILSGPELPSSDQERFRKLAENLPNCQFGEFSDDIMSEMDAADLVISMGGYNTICEILTLRKPAIVIPRAQPVHEQRIRAERMSAMGLFTMVRPETLSPKAIVDNLKLAFENRSKSAQIPINAVPLDGLENLSEAIDALLDKCEADDRGAIGLRSIATA